MRMILWSGLDVNIHVVYLNLFNIVEAQFKELLNFDGFVV